VKLSLVEVAGFRGFRSSVSVPVADGFLIVNGPNGSGKSTLIDAIEFAMTGQISRLAQVSENLERVENYIWWRGPGKPLKRYVHLVFDLADHSKLDLVRQPEGVTFRVRDRSGGTHLLEPAASRRYFVGESGPEDRFLDRLCRSTIIRDDLITELSVDASESSRFSLVRDTLGSTQLPDIEHRLMTTKRVLDNRVIGLERKSELAHLEVHRLVAQTSELLSEFEAEPDSEQARQALIAALEVSGDIHTDDLMRKARSRVIRLRNQISILSRSIPRLQEIERRHAEIETPVYQSRDSELQIQLGKVAEAVNLAQNVRNEAEQVASQLEERQPYVHSLGELIEHGRQVGLDNGRCPLCNSEIPQAFFESHLRTIEARVEGELAGLSTALSRRREALEAERVAELRRRQVEAALREHRRVRDELSEELNDVVRETKEFAGFEEVSTGTIKAALDKARSALVPIEQSLAVFEMSAAYARLREQEKILADARNHLASVQRSLDAARRAISHQEEASRTVRRVAGALVDERLAQLEPLLIELYERLRPHVQWSTIGYKIRGDVKRFMRLTVGDDELNPRFMFSSGQRRALGLAFLLAVHLSTTWSRWNTLILDDPMQHVDDYRALHLAEVLGSIRRSGRQVLCSVEDRSLANLLARRLATSDSEHGSLVQLKYELNVGSTIAVQEVLPALKSRLFSAA